MSDPTTRRAWWPWLGLAGFLVLATWGLWLTAANEEGLADQLLFVVTFSLFGLAGALIASRVPGNRIGALLLFVSGMAAATFVAGQYALYAAGRGDTSLVARWMGFLGEIGWLVGLLPGLMLLLLWFPDGRPPSPRWRWLTVTLGVVVAWGILAILGEAEFDQSGLANPVYVSWLEPVGHAFGIGFLVFVGLLAASVLSLVFRFRRARGAERQQIKWVAFSAVVMFVGMLLAEVLTGPLSTTVTDMMVAFALATLPVAIGIAVLRYRLWDLDVVVRKTVLAAFVVVILMAVFLVLSYIAQATVNFGGAADVVVAAIVGFAIWPAFRLARRLADRVVFGGRATPFEVLAGFADRVGATYAGDDVLLRMVTAVGEGVGAERTDVWLDHEGDTVLAATWPVDAPAEGAVVADDERSAVYPVEFNGEQLGRLGARMGAGERMTGTEHKLIANLAAQAGPLLHNVSLTEALKSRLAELHAARRRLVAAQDEERRRLERNIHDGAQQQLVALAVKLRLADGTIDRDPAAAHAMLAGLQEDATTALEDLRDLARGVYPPLLVDQGLAAALDAQARRSPVPVQVHADGIGRFPVEVEAAVYFTCLEGLQNVAKYAQATTVDVAVARANGHLEFSVHDDGRGFDTDTTTYGMGLRGMADRLAALDGDLVVTSAPGNGTTITGRVPVEAAP